LYTEFVPESLTHTTPENALFAWTRGLPEGWLSATMRAASSGWPSPRTSDLTLAAFAPPTGATAELVEALEQPAKITRSATALEPLAPLINDIEHS
jgi:hypothetical protein